MRCLSPKNHHQWKWHGTFSVLMINNVRFDQIQTNFFLLLLNSILPHQYSIRTGFFHLPFSRYMIIWKTLTLFEYVTPWVRPIKRAYLKFTWSNVEKLKNSNSHINADALSQHYSLEEGTMVSWNLSAFILICFLSLYIMIAFIKHKF